MSQLILQISLFPLCSLATAQMSDSRCVHNQKLALAFCEGLAAEQVVGANIANNYFAVPQGSGHIGTAGDGFALIIV
jgi:hypothetical protein